MRRLCRLGVLALALIVAVTAAGCGQDPEVAKKEHFDKGNQLFEQKKYREAAIEYRTAIQFDARYAEARLKLADSYEKLGDSPAALGEYVRAADLLPNDVEAQVKAASYLLAGGLLEDASSRTQKALRIKPTHLQARLLLAYATAGLTDLDAGAAQVEELIRMDPNQPTVFAQLGRFRLAQRNVPQAEKAFRAAYELAPNSVETLIAMADFYMSTGRPADAEQWLKKALAQAPQEARTNRMLAAFYMQTRRFAEAEGPLKTYVESTSQPKTRLVLADYYFATNRSDKAREILDALKSDDQTFADARIRLSVLAFVNGRVPEATQLLDEVLAKEPKNARALTMKGRYLIVQSKYSDAMPLLKAAVEADSGVAEAHYWLGVAYRQVGDNESAKQEFGRVQALEPSEVGSKLQLSQLSLLEGQAKAALALATGAVTSQPQNVQAHIARIDALIAANDLKTALAEATRLAAAVPNSSLAQRELGRIYMKQRQSAMAEVAFKRAYDLSAAALDVLGELVDARLAAGKLTEARAVVDEAIAKDPKNSQLLLYRARVHKASNDNVGAERALQDALAVNPRDLQAYLELSRIYIAGNRLDDARKQLEALLLKSPKQVWIETLIGMTFELQNRKPEARDHYRKALEFDPRAAIAANNLAMIYADTGEDLGAALELAQISVQQTPNSPEANDTLGWVYLKRNLPTQAISPLEVSVSQDPGNPVYHYHLALALSQAGERVRARAALTRALNLGKDFDGIADARRLLGTL